MLRERDIERYLVAQCRAQNFLIYKFTSPGASGVPDRLIIADGTVVFVELKAPGQKPRPLQIATHDQMRKAGARVHIIDSKQGVNELIYDLIHNAQTKPSRRKKPRKKTPSKGV